MLETDKQPAIIDVVTTPAPEQTVEIHILKNSHQTECKFWLGLYKPGSLLVEQIVGLKNIKDTFYQAATIGLQSTDPVLITTVDEGEIRYVFLIPTNESNEVLPKAYWMSNLAKALHGLQASEIGCYIPRELETDPSQHELLEELMLNLIFSTKIARYYLLAGEFGANPILNVALSLKSELQSQQHIKTTVFH